MYRIYWGPNKVIVYQPVHKFSWQNNASERFTTALILQQKAAFIFNNKNIYNLCFNEPITWRKWIVIKKPASIFLHFSSFEIYFDN